MLRLAFDFIITWRETRTRPNAYLQIIQRDLPLHQPRRSPEVQHHEKLQQRVVKDQGKQDPETQTEVKHAKTLLPVQVYKPAQLVTEQCYQLIFHRFPSSEGYHLPWFHRAR